MKKVLLIALILFVQACNKEQTDANRSSATVTSGSITQEQCDAFGGKLVNGQCQKELPEAEMRKICDSQGLAYVKELNGCVQGQ